jgi:hypothetical protein
MAAEAPAPAAAPVYALTPGEVQVGTPNGPGIYLAPVGTAGPVDTVTPWPSGWNILGYLSDAGPTVGQTTSNQDITPWQSYAPIRSVITSRQITLQFVMWQLNTQTLALYFDADVPVPAVDGSFSMPVITSKSGHMYAVGIDAADGTRVMRMIIGKARLSAAGNMAITRGAAVPLDVTLTALDQAGTLMTVLVGPPAAGLLMEASDNGTGAAEATNGRHGSKAA